MKGTCSDDAARGSVQTAVAATQSCAFREATGMGIRLVKAGCDEAAGLMVTRADTHLMRACQYVSERLGEPLSTRKVARHVRPCPAYLCRLFKKQTGATFLRWLAQARVRRAQRRLRCSSKSIAEIGYASGSLSVSQFNPGFKRNTGLTPTQCRRWRDGDGSAPPALHGIVARPKRVATALTPKRQRAEITGVLLSPQQAHEQAHSQKSISRKSRSIVH